MPFCASKAQREMDGDSQDATTGTGAGAGAGAGAGPAGLLQQLHRRVRSRCCPNEAATASTEQAAPPSVPASVGSVGLALPCLLESWKRRIECMAEAESPGADDRSRRHGNRSLHHHHHRSARCHRQRHRDRSADKASDSLAPPEVTSKPVNDQTQSGCPPVGPPLQPPCLFRGFELPKLMHPRLERQRACASLSGIWGVVLSPPSSPEGEGPAPTTRTWRRCHPYWRGNGTSPSSP